MLGLEPALSRVHTHSRVSHGNSGRALHAEGLQGLGVSEALEFQGLPST